MKKLLGFGFMAALALSALTSCCCDRNPCCEDVCPKPRCCEPRPACCKPVCCEPRYVDNCCY